MTKYVAKGYILLCYLCKKYTSIRLPGLGKIQRILKHDFIFPFKGKKMYYKAGIEGSYDLLLIGRSNEPETHLLMDRLATKLPQLNFVDVGASVGEMVVGASTYKNMEAIFAFEPRLDCVESLQRTVEVNKETRIKIVPNIVSSSEEEITIFMNPGGTSSGIYDSGGGDATAVKVKSVKLDTALPRRLENTILLVDVEGAEPLVLQSGIGFIKANRPLIVFEFNAVSKQHFTLQDITGIIGNQYDIFRLKEDGGLDKDFSNSWNCVAIPQNSLFHEVLLP